MVCILCICMFFASKCRKFQNIDVLHIPVARHMYLVIDSLVIEILKKLSRLTSLEYIVPFYICTCMYSIRLQLFTFQHGDDINKINIHLSQLDSDKFSNLNVRLSSFLTFCSIRFQVGIV